MSLVHVKETSCANVKSLNEDGIPEHINIAKYVIDNQKLTIKTILGRVRNKVTDSKYVNPVGNQNAKTGCLGTYRPVGDTCPDTCQFLDNGCYAQSGNVALHQRRASLELRNSLNSAALALALGAVKHEIVRLHVSGDFVTNSNGSKEIDIDYILGLIEICKFLNDSGFSGILGYTYTHIPKDQFQPYKDMLSDYISVMYSDYLGAGGAVVWPHEDRNLIRQKTDAKVYMCPSQRTDGEIKCKECKLCFDNPQKKNRLVIFDPHGSSAKKIKRRIRNNNLS